MVENPQVQLEAGVMGYNIVSVNDEGAKAQMGHEVSIAYRLFRHCGPETVVAQSDVEEPYKFILGANSVIRGFEIAVNHLRIGQKGTFLVPSDQAYGKVG